MLYIVRLVIVLVTLAILSSTSGGQRTLAPTDERKLNAFADEYNEYVTTLKEKGIIDVAKWKRVEHRWENLK